MYPRTPTVGDMLFQGLFNQRKCFEIRCFGTHHKKMSEDLEQDREYSITAIKNVLLDQKGS